MATTTATGKRTRTAPSPAPPEPSVAELAEHWLKAKRALESAGQAAKGHSDRDRRADLARWGRLLTAGSQDPDEDLGLDVATDLAGVGLADLNTPVPRRTPFATTTASRSRCAGCRKPRSAS